MKTSDQINEIAGALAKAQATMTPAIKDATNPAFRSKYADLTAVWEACRKPLTANGIATVQDVEATENGIAVTTRLTHTSGQWIEFGPLVVPTAKKDAHGVGSATSYGRRYALSAAVGIVSDDDDGNAAVGRQQARQEQPVMDVSGFVEADAPDGYEAWLEDLASVAEEGTQRLEETWRKSHPDFRRRLTKMAPANWQALKDLAAKRDPVKAGAR